MQKESVFSYSNDFRQQRGQARMWDIASTVRLASKDRFFAHLCTGYGKTLLAYGMFGILRARGLVDCMLVLVPGDEQRSQFVDDAEDANELIGVHASPLASEKASREIIGVRDGRIDVLVATYQQLNDHFFNDTFCGRRVFLVADECHHLAQTWGSNAAALKRTATLFLSATPVRSDEKALIGVPDEPDVKVTYAEAYEEKVVRRIYGEIDHFCLHVTCDGEKRQICTEDLKNDGVKDFSAYEAKKRLRYDTDYLDWMLLNPLQELSHRNQLQPKQHQMIVFAMTCKHADYVCQQLQTIQEQFGYGFVIDWVGVGAGNDGQVKTNAENRAIVDSFKKGHVDVLVQVDKAGEGFSCKTASVLVFIHLIGFDGKLMQQLGRGIRRNDKLPFDHDSCAVFASADTDIARLVVEMEQQICEAHDKGPSEPQERQLPLFEINDLVLVDSKHDRTEFVGGVLSAEESKFCEHYNIPEEHYLATASGRRKRASAMDSVKDQRQAFDSVREQVKHATSTLCGNIIRLMKKQSMIIDRSTVGNVKKSINTRWKCECGRSHDDMLTDDFQAKHKWLQKVNADLKADRRLPSWV